jgi:hypothetical protein
MTELFLNNKWVWWIEWFFDDGNKKVFLIIFFTSAFFPSRFFWSLFFAHAISRKEANPNFKNPTVEKKKSNPSDDLSGPFSTLVCLSVCLSVCLCFYLLTNRDSANFVSSKFETKKLILKLEIEAIVKSNQRISFSQGRVSLTIFLNIFCLRTENDSLKNDMSPSTYGSTS